MPVTDEPGNIWYPDDLTPIKPLRNLFLLLAQSVNDALKGFARVEAPIPISTFGTGVTVGSVPPRIYRLGKMVYLQGIVLWGANSGVGNVLTIPDGYRPDRRELVGDGFSGNTGSMSPLSFQLETNGTLSLNRIQAAIPSGAQLQLNLRWRIA